MSCVVATGTVSTGLTIYGPFGSEHRAMKWAKCNSVTDLDNVPWEVVELESPLPEDHEEETCHKCGEPCGPDKLCDCEVEERSQHLMGKGLETEDGRSLEAMDDVEANEWEGGP